MLLLVLFVFCDSSQYLIANYIPASTVILSFYWRIGGVAGSLYVLGG